MENIEKIEKKQLGDVESRFDADDLMPQGKAARLLGVSLQSLRRWANAGVITPAIVTIGGHRRYRDRDIERLWLQLRGRAAPTDKQ